MKNLRLTIAASLLALFGTVCLAADKASTYGLRYDNVVSRNLWLGGTNVVGMRADSLKASTASIGGSFRHNGYKSTWGEAHNQWSADAGASSIVHLKKFSMAGSFSFCQTMLYNACGSMFLSPGRFPVDISEFTPGTKISQKYSFDGGLSVDLTPELRAGGQIAFQSVNCAKRKDLRYTDYALDFRFRPGLQWHKGDCAVGASFLFERNTETITAQQIGEAAEPYQAFLDKGLFYGAQAEWQGASLHIDEAGINGFPVREMGYGVAIQGSWKGLYADFSFLHANGKVGEKDGTFFTFPSNRFEGAIAWKMTSDKGTEQIFRLDLSYQGTNLRETILEKTTTGGVLTRTTYGDNLIQKKGVFSIAPSWSAVRAKKFEASASFKYIRNEGLAMQMYPCFDSQILRQVTGTLDGRLILKQWSILGNVCLRKGWLKDESGVDSTSDGILAKSSLAHNDNAFQTWKLYQARAFASLTLGARYDWKNGLFLQGTVGTSTLGRSNLWRPQADLHFGIEF